MKNKIKFTVSSVILMICSLHALAAVKIEVETRILDFDPFPGMKSTQTVNIDFDAEEVKSEYKTGTTDFFGVNLTSIRDKFKVSNVSFKTNSKGSKSVTIKVEGETASGVGVIPNINYSMTISVSQNGDLIKVDGCHDSYPAYKVDVNDKNIYSFKHKSKNIIGLFGECDVPIK